MDAKLENVGSYYTTRSQAAKAKSAFLAKHPGKYVMISKLKSGKFIIKAYVR